MRDRLYKAWRRRRFTTAYIILRNEARHHRAAGHNIKFEAVNESYMMIKCDDCPELNP